MKLHIRLKGGAGSGYYGHKGRAGKLGGSSSMGSSSYSSKPATPTKGKAGLNARKRVPVDNSGPSNPRELEMSGIGSSRQGTLKVGQDIDFYDKAGNKQYGQVTSTSQKGYSVKQQKNGKFEGETHKFEWYDPSKKASDNPNDTKSPANKTTLKNLQSRTDKIKPGTKVTVDSSGKVLFNGKATNNLYIRNGRVENELGRVAFGFGDIND